MSVTTPMRLIQPDAPDNAEPQGYIPRHGLIAVAATGPLVVVPWSRWGRNRLYVNTADGQQVGWVDLDTGDRSLAMPELASAFETAVSAVSVARLNGATGRYTPRRITDPGDPGPAPAPQPARRTGPDSTDLAANRPGEHLEARITAALEAGQELEPACPGFQGKRAYSSWELGLLGERRVAEELDRLVALDPRWAYVNSIPVGTNSSDIDQLVVGPGGVFTLNAKHHHDGKVWVGEDAVMVNGVWKHYVRNSRHEAERAGKLLAAAARTDLTVRGLVVPVGIADLVVREQPAGVAVVEVSQLVAFLMSQLPVLDAATTDLVLACARLGSTWR